MYNPVKTGYTIKEEQLITELAPVTFVERIAERLDRSTETVINKMERMGLSYTRRGEWLRKKRNVNIVRYYHLGYSPTEIAKTMYIDVKVVKRVLANPPQVNLLNPNKLLNQVFK